MTTFIPEILRGSAAIILRISTLVLVISTAISSAFMPMTVSMQAPKEVAVKSVGEKA